MTSRDPLSETFLALSDPTRRAILARLQAGEATAGELAEPFGISRPAISRHLKVLERAGLVSRSRDKQWRRFRVLGSRLSEAHGWLEQYEVFWEESFDRLAEHLAKTAPASSGKGANKKTKEKKDGKRRSKNRS